MLLPSTLFSLKTFKHNVSQYIAIKALFGWGGGDVVNIKRREEVKVGVK